MSIEDGLAQLAAVLSRLVGIRENNFASKAAPLRWIAAVSAAVVKQAKHDPEAFSASSQIISGAKGICAAGDCRVQDSAIFSGEPKI
ncbi:MAG: hypothetical protein IKS45_06225 [Thermoguttaceae bacterium]|nr:hypothetical protein [Thermoguttaceae bacterium]